MSTSASSACAAVGSTVVSAPPPPPPLDLLHDEYGPQVNALNWSMVAISGVFLALRIYLKIDRRRALGWDDYTLVLAWILQTVQVVITTVSIAFGFGKHTWDVPMSNFALLPILGTLVATISLLAAALGKTSFGLTLLRLPIGSLKYLVWAIIAALNVVSLVAAASNWPRCEWSPQGAFCIPVETIVAYGVFTGIFSAAMDFILVLIPWKILWKLRMERSDKIGVMTAMSMGVFAGIASILKALQVHALEGGDLTLGIGLTLWATADSAVTIVACSIPMLRALLGSGIPPAYQGELAPKISLVSAIHND